MIVIDTNVVSEISRERPSLAVQIWFDSQPRDQLFLCTPVLAELRYGVERLAAGRRRTLLSHAIEQLVNEGFLGQILSLDRAAANEFGRVVAARERLRRPIGTMDGLIAAIAIMHGAAVATRDVSDFSDLSLEIINPFMA